MTQPRIIVKVGSESVEVSPGKTTEDIQADNDGEDVCCGGCSSHEGGDDLLMPLFPANAKRGSVAGTSIQLYDADSTLDISKEVANGYLVLLTGGLMTEDAVGKRKLKKGKKATGSSTGAPSSGESSSQISGSSSRIPESAIQLAFMSLTDGNVVDVTFGVHTSGGMKRSRDTSSIAYNMARGAKEALREASYSSDAIPRIAVETYETCFEVVVDYQKKVDSLGFFSRCYQREIIRGEAQESLEEAFATLAEAVEAAT